MNLLKIVIVGGVAGGASAAAKARRVNEQASIKLFERGPYVSFANCGLPYYIGDEIKDRDDLLLQTPESFWRRFRVDVKVLHEIVRIDRDKKIVEVKNLKSGELFQESYDKLILAPGAGAIVPDLPGIKSENIFTIKTVPESDAVKNFILQHQPKRAVVVGAGFIGLESAEALKRRGIEVTVIEMLNQVLPPFDPDVAQFVSQHLEASGIAVVLGDGIKRFHGEGPAKEIELQSGRRIPMDLAILSMGVRPELSLARNAGLKIGEAGGIAVNEFQQTSDPDIYAAGDAVEVIHLVTEKKSRIPLAGPANKQGRVAGANAAGEKLAFHGALGTAIVESMGITAAKTGLSEREARSAGYDAAVSFTHSPDHAGYYPGAGLLHIKLISEKNSGRLLGAQIVGEKGVDKRIDVLATALSARLKVMDLENLDLAYAPQFSSAKDPVVIAGFVASNVLRRNLRTTTCEELRARLNRGDDIQVLDVRTKREYETGHIDGAIQIPIDELRERIAELDPKKETIIYCRVGLRGYLAARILEQSGFEKVLNLTGGILVCPHQKEKEPAVSSNEIPVKNFYEVLKNNHSIVLDVREEDEYRYESIQKTVNFPLSQLEQEMRKLPRNQEIYVLCQTGIRSAQAAEQLRRAGFKRIREVRGGIESWKSEGYSVLRGKGTIPIIRQVQIVTGSLALVGGIFSRLHWLAALIGAGLLFAGISGNCGLALLLARMPWNKNSASGKITKDSCGSCG